MPKPHPDPLCRCEPCWRWYRGEQMRLLGESLEHRRGLEALARYLFSRSCRLEQAADGRTLLVGPDGVAIESADTLRGIVKKLGLACKVRLDRRR